MLAFSKDDEAFRTELRSWLQDNYELFKASCSKQPFNPHDLLTRREWEDRLCAAGWSAFTWPQAYGGRGLPLSRQVVFLQEYAKFDCPQPANGIGHSILAPTLLHFGSEAQKLRFLPRVASNQDVWCQGYSEPGAGSDLAALKTRARREDGHYLLNGHKVWTTGGHVADWCFVLARTDPDARPHAGISFLLVDLKSPGVRVEQIRQINGEDEFCEIFFEDVRVPAENLVGPENEGWRVAMSAANFERSTYYVPHQIRLAEDLKRVWALFQHTAADAAPETRAAWRARLARLAVQINGLRLIVERGLEQSMQGLPPGPESSYTKLLGSEALQSLYDCALDLLGDRAKLSPVGDPREPETNWIRQFLWSRCMTIAAGASEIHRNIIAERTLGLPR